MCLDRFLNMYCVSNYEVYYNCERCDIDSLWLIGDALIYYVCAQDDTLLIYVSDSEVRPLGASFSVDQLIVHLDSTGQLSYLGLYENMPLRILGAYTRSIYAEGGAIIFDERSNVYDVKEFSR